MTANAVCANASPESEGSMSSGYSYDQDLRAIGQSLESRRIYVFELKNEAGQYIVRGVPEKDSNLLARLRHWRTRPQNGPSSLNYGAAQIERLHRDGRSKRSKADRLPDFYSLPNTLRTVGSYLNSRNADLLELHKSALGVTLLYQDANGHPNMEERSIASFYNLFIALHDRRRKH